MSKSRLDRRLVSLTAPGSFAAEQYQGLRLTVARLLRQRTAQVVAVTSPASGEGKTVTAINLAAALARGVDARALLIDADLHRPSVARQLNLPAPDAPGFAEVLAAEESPDLAGVVQRVEHTSLAVIPAGTSRTAVLRSLQPQRLTEVLDGLRQRYDFIVLDTPPLLPVFDAALLTRSADVVLLVVAAGQTPRKLLGESLRLLDESKVMGIVFNKDDQPLFGYYDGYYRSYFSGETPIGAGG